LGDRAAYRHWGQIRGKDHDAKGAQTPET